MIKFSLHSMSNQKGYTTLMAEVNNKVWQEKNDRFMKRTKCKNRQSPQKKPPNSGGNCILCVSSIHVNNLFCVSRPMWLINLQNKTLTTNILLCSVK